MFLKMADKALFIGFEDCQYSNNAVDLLISKGFDTTFWKASKKRGSKIPENIQDWNGEYIFHFKSYCILPKDFIERASIAAINFHPSHPRYPGSGGINWALYNEDDETGVTVHYLNEKVDNGPIINVYRVTIEESDDVASLIDKVHRCQFDSFANIIHTITIQGSSELSRIASENTNKWGKKTGRIRDIDKLENIDINISKEKLDKIIKSTYYNGYGPKLKIHGYTFRYSGE
tara:strand:+ start:1492 stop:2187 length:696 start_codon:yes stop_codon:yes gene_type:complete